MSTLTKSDNDLRAEQPVAPAACVPRAVAAAARSTPGAVALRLGAARLSYAELDAGAARLAAHLRSLGVRPEVPVGICLDRSFDGVVAALGVWKAGGACLLMDPAWPEERRRIVLDDARAPVVIGKGGTAERLAGARRVGVALDRDARKIACREPAEDCADVREEHLAYIVCTSGSSGEPKGVEITHGNLANLVAWHRRAFAVSPADRASHLAGLGFDAAVWEIWPYLSAGASVSLPVDGAVRASPDLLHAWLVAEAVTVAFVPTALAEPMLAAAWPAGTRLRYLLTGGDTLHARPRPGLPFAVVNNYGPAECTVVATSGIVPPERDGEPDSLPPLGWPIANAQVHVLDEQGRPVAPGATGEIHVGGAGVGRGYRHRPHLTAERFLPDGFRPVPGARLYRTGDLGCLLPDGQLAFRGRIDAQAKIRGQRLEPDEIACALDRHPLVAASAVAARSDLSPSHPGGKRLVAYVVPVAAVEPRAGELREFLAARLPGYMVPAVFVRCESLPVTANGKLDRGALPEPGPDNELAEGGYRAPRTPVEQRLVRIVADLLGGRRVGADDNFFLVGGHSLLGTQLVLRARDAFGVEVTLRHLFEAGTVANLASLIEALLVERLAAMSEEEARVLAAAG